MILPKMKICRTTPSALVHGPKEYGGLEIKDIHTLQGIAHVKAILEEASSQSATGKLLRILKEYHALEVGLKMSVYDLPYNKVKECMTDTWMKNTLEFLSNTEITIKSDEPLIADGWTEGDTSIMQDALDAGYSGTALAAINRCRIHMKALFRSDISDMRGLRVTQEAYNVMESINGSTSERSYVWQHQERPSAQDRTMWRKFMHKAYNITRQYQDWETPCGAWKSEATTHSQWTYGGQQDELYEKVGTEERWRLWKRHATNIPRRRRTGLFKETEEIVNERELNTSVCIIDRRTGLNDDLVNMTDVLETMTKANVETQQEAAAGTLREELDRIHHSLQWVVEDIELPGDNGSALAAAIQEGQGRCMSDGSLKDLFGTSGFTSMMADETKNYVGANRVPGEDDEQSSYRSELIGILANILVHNALCKAHGITERHEITIGCDNESAIWTAFGGEDIEAGAASSDILHAIRYQLRKSPLKWKAKWIKGHQDDGNKSLDTWALANIACDVYAERKWNSTVAEGGKLRPEVGVLLGEKETIWIHNRKISSEIDKAIYDKVHRDNIIHYWARTGRITKGTEGLIDWEGHKRAMKAFRGRQQWVTKHFSGWAGSGTMMNKWKQRDTLSCHRCGEEETTRHVLQCQAPDSITQYRNLREDLDSWLKKTTSYAIAKAVLTHLDDYQKKKQVTDMSELHPSTHLAAVYQATIGPRSFGEGLLSSQWRVAQQRHYANKESKEKSRRWVTKLIQKLWEVSWGMWEFRNNDVHTNAETRQKLYIQGIFKDIEIVKAKAAFCTMLTAKERKFINTPDNELKRKSERGQLDWICRAEQFVSTTRMTQRLKQATGQYFVLHARNLRRNVQQGITQYTTRIEETTQGTANEQEAQQAHNNSEDSQRAAKRQRTHD